MSLQPLLPKIATVATCFLIWITVDSPLVQAQGTLPPSTYPVLTPPLPAPFPNPAYTPPDLPSVWPLLAQYPNVPEDRKKLIVEQLTKLVQQEFERRHVTQEQEIKALEAQLAQKKKAFEKREAIKGKIVADRVASLIETAEGTGWEPLSESMHPALTPPTWMPVHAPPTPLGVLPNTIPPAVVAPNTGAATLLGPPTTQPSPLSPPEAPSNYPKARVSYEDFKELVAEVEPHRQSRILSLDQFLEMSNQPNVIILDTRSDFRYQRIHIKGAKHLSFTDFTQANLAETIPSPETPVLIYCNNNFDGNPIDFASKSAPPRPRANPVIQSQVAAQNKPVQLALNVPTYINLYGYGYRNVYELGELVKVTDPRIQFEGSMVGKEK